MAYDRDRFDRDRPDRERGLVDRARERISEAGDRIEGTAGEAGSFARGREEGLGG